jgi:hypothetical protein
MKTPEKLAESESSTWRFLKAQDIRTPNELALWCDADDTSAVEWSEIKALQRDAQATLSRTQRNEGHRSTQETRRRTASASEEAPREPVFPVASCKALCTGKPRLPTLCFRGKRRENLKEKGKKKIQRKIFAHTPTCRLWMNVTWVKEQVHRP